MTTPNDSYPAGEPQFGNDLGSGGYPTAGYPTDLPIDEQLPMKNALAPWTLGLAIVSVVVLLSIFGTIFAWIPAVISVILAIVSLIKLRKMPLGSEPRKGMTISALIIGLVVTIISVAVAILLVAVLKDTLGECASLETSEQQQECVNQKVNELNQNK
ncbi:DUF4190 domain-containing protein [Corynebacterium diphtheriae bv. mitis]|uniref:DUF4190 domain-containing protein n=1 Tax=Corynebacterium diphtheriae TaxID=1717 RepID=UPI0018CA0AD8|nr:DUF4190 domain-containing protein [Corynebacterium diphtheriae]MBG9253288.1 DUF4190 domain-containing protein [Corynebacterium diphtheriae bv. mitis]